MTLEKSTLSFHPLPNGEQEAGAKTQVAGQVAVEQIPPPSLPGLERCQSAGALNSPEPSNPRLLHRPTDVPQKESEHDLLASGLTTHEARSFFVLFIQNALSTPAYRALHRAATGRPPGKIRTSIKTTEKIYAELSIPLLSEVVDESLGGRSLLAPPRSQTREGEGEGERKDDRFRPHVTNEPPLQRETKSPTICAHFMQDHYRTENDGPKDNSFMPIDYKAQATGGESEGERKDDRFRPHVANGPPDTGTRPNAPDGTFKYDNHIADGHNTLLSRHTNSDDASNPEMKYTVDLNQPDPFNNMWRAVIKQKHRAHIERLLRKLRDAVHGKKTARDENGHTGHSELSTHLMPAEEVQTIGHLVLELFNPYQEVGESLADRKPLENMEDQRNTKAILGEKIPYTKLQASIKFYQPRSGDQGFSFLVLEGLSLQEQEIYNEIHAYFNESFIKELNKLKPTNTNSCQELFWRIGLFVLALCKVLVSAQLIRVVVEKSFENLMPETMTKWLVWCSFSINAYVCINTRGHKIIGMRTKWLEDKLRQEYITNPNLVIQKHFLPTSESTLKKCQPKDLWSWAALVGTAYDAGMAYLALTSEPMPDKLKWIVYVLGIVSVLVSSGAFQWQKAKSNLNSIIKYYDEGKLGWNIIVYAVLASISQIFTFVLVLDTLEPSPTLTGIIIIGLLCKLDLGFLSSTVSLIIESTKRKNHDPINRPDKRSPFYFFPHRVIADNDKDQHLNNFKCFGQIVEAFALYWDGILSGILAMVGFCKEMSSLCDLQWQSDRDNAPWLTLIMIGGLILGTINTLATCAFANRPVVGRRKSANIGQQLQNDPADDERSSSPLLIERKPPWGSAQVRTPPPLRRTRTSTFASLRSQEGSDSVPQRQRSMSLPNIMGY